MPSTKTVPDKDALRRIGNRVRERLGSDPGAYRIETDRADLFAIGGFLTRAECERLCLMIDCTARPSTLHGTGHDRGFRTSYSGDLDPHDDFVKAISRRIDERLGLPGETGETLQGQRYNPGQEFKPHHDWFHTSEAYWQDERRRGGQRSWTAMAFLGAVEAGGETHFVDLGIKLQPERGVLIAWNNAGRDGTPNPDTLHAGEPVIAGTKYIITRWYRTRRWR